MRVTVLLAPFDESSLEDYIGEREGFSIDDFALRLGKAPGLAVSIVEGGWERAPGDGFIVVFDSLNVVEHPELAPRTIVVNMSRSAVPEYLERLKLAGGIEAHRYMLWQETPDADRGDGVFGRREIAPLISAEFLMAPVYLTENYALLASPLYKDLPGLLAGYLQAYERVHPSLVNPPWSIPPASR
jgi:hypothetical protein